MRRLLLAAMGLALGLGGLTSAVQAMCGYFRPIVVDIKQSPEILQPSQIAFITWDPVKKLETVTVQPRFEGNARDFAMVIPTPGQPKLHEMPRDLFKALGVFTRPKQRVIPESKLMPRMMQQFNLARGLGGEKAPAAKDVAPPRPTTVEVLEAGVVGSLDYKIISAGRPDDLYQWLKDNKYNYGGDEATLDFYVRQKYYFTVMKIDTLQMKRNPDGSYTGDVTPTRFTFPSDKLVYPLKITQVSVKDKTEAVFYVQAPTKMDLAGDMTYQYHWVSLLDFVQSTIGPGDLTEKNRAWMKEIHVPKADLIKRGGELGFQFQFQQGRPFVDAKPKGRTPTTLEWAKRLTADDIKVLSGELPYSETAPDPDDGFTRVDLQNPRKAPAIYKVIERRLAKYQQDRPRGYLVRQASKEDLKLLPILKGHVQEGQYLTRFRKSFTTAEMNEDLVLTPAHVGQVGDMSEHEELLRTMQWGGRGRFPRGVEFDRLIP